MMTQKLYGRRWNSGKPKFVDDSKIVWSKLKLRKSSIGWLQEMYGLGQILWKPILDEVLEIVWP